ncbi:DUF3829 domain-containing protein [Pseudomonas kairouanensis]|uniref:DUF3829 domain-containing protein n=1 Tax=Pseudomonas kairouanensis TaxID=2293832 RepID=A0A4Z0AMG6_9PSED|nr:DUF3829 domain-containing protein [Pseudomonas kairouanensis]TFY87563.1 DUF3829 domain-containing protein [Pseudomonas kairouanensis]
MNPKWLLPISLVLGLGLLGVAGATKPLQRVQLWLDQRDSPHTATASALAPIINCVNRIDRDTRLAYYRQRSTQSEAPDNDKFGDRNEPEPRLIQAAVCSQLYTLKLERQAPASPLIGLANDYADRLNKFTSLADSVAPMYRVDGIPPSTQQMVADVMNKHRAQELRIKGEDYLRASAKLRQQLGEEDLHVRPAQLARVESRFGRDVHWHILNYMIAARQAVNHIEHGMRDKTLTPDTVAALAQTLQQAADGAKAYIRKATSPERDEAAEYLWYTITPAADAYLAALHTLEQNWREHAPPQQLSDDYYLATRRYDALLSYYNRQARNTF